MKLVTYLKDGHDQLALLINGQLYDTDALHPDLPISMAMFLNYWDDMYPLAMAAEKRVKEGTARTFPTQGFDDAEIIAPVPHASSLRDAMAFGKHAELVAKNRREAYMSVFNQYPVFFFGNHNSIQGPGDIVCMPDHFEKLDYELEAAVVICRHCRNVPAAEADDNIAGLMIMNDISARKLQGEEMLLNMGPAKGKDFATAIGPMLVTLDELAAFEVPCKENHTGKSWNLSMKCSVNGVELSNGNLSDMDWTFAEIIERCSYGVNLYPGDIIGSGTVGTGCLLDLNETGKQADANYEEQWLKKGDTIEMEIEGLGTLTNTIAEEDSELSILALKK